MSMSPQGIHARGMAAGYSAGAQHIQQINEDRARVRFIQALIGHPNRMEFNLTDLELGFLIRMENDHNRTVPDIHSGDRNICDSLRRRFEKHLKNLQ